MNRVDASKQPFSIEIHARSSLNIHRSFHHSALFSLPLSFFLFFFFGSVARKFYESAGRTKGVEMVGNRRSFFLFRSLFISFHILDRWTPIPSREKLPRHESSQKLNYWTFLAPDLLFFFARITSRTMLLPRRLGIHTPFGRTPFPRRRQQRKPGKILPTTAWKLKTILIKGAYRS